MWRGLLDLKDGGEADLHPRTAEGLIKRDLAKQISILPNGRILCRITKTGRDHGRGLRDR